MPKPGLVAVPVAGETVVYDPPSDALHRLDAPASAVWARLDGTATVQALAASIAEEFGIPEATARADVAALVQTLRERGLLAGSPAPVNGRPASDAASVHAAAPAGEPSAARYAVGRYRALEHTFEVATSDAGVRDYLAEVLTDLAATDDGMAAASRYDLVDRFSAVDHGRSPAPEIVRDQRPGTRGEGRWVVRDGDEVVLATDWLDRALYALLWYINAETVRRSAPRYPVVHAAGATYDGAAVLLPAPPDAGKTTTVAGLVRAGFRYLTDEAVAIDPDTLHALPYPKALSIDRGSWDVLAGLQPPHHRQIDGQWQLPASSIRPGAVAGATPIRFVVLPSYDRGATTRLEPAHRAEMLMHLADSAFRFQDAPRRNLEVLAGVVEGAACYRLVLSDLDEAVRLVRELVRT